MQATSSFTRIVSWKPWVILTLVAVNVNAAVTTYTSRSAWESAVGGAADSTESFASVGSDVEFDTGTNPLSLTGFSIGVALESGGSTFGNFVDDLPIDKFPQNPVNGTDYASMSVNGDAPTTVPEITFNSAVFGAGMDINLNDFGTETVTIELRDAGNNLEGTLTITGDGFLGFKSDTPIQELRFTGNGNGGPGGTSFGIDGVSLKVDAPVSNTAPGASLSANDVGLGATGNTSYTFDVTYTDDSGIDFSTIGTSDVTVTGPGGGVPVTGVSVNIESDGSPRVATYTITPPGGAWDLSDNGTYTVAMASNQVGDDDPSQLFVGSGTLGTFEVRASSGFATTFTVRSSWTAAIGGSGEVDFEEDFEGFNGGHTLDWSSTTVASPPGSGGNFTLARVGGSSTFGNFVDIDSGVQFGDVTGATVNYAAVFVEGDSGLTVEMTFDTAVAAFCLELVSHDTDEDVEIDLYNSSDTLLDSLAIPADGVFGFTSASPGTVKKLVFQAATPDGGGGGEVFGIDNIVAATSFAGSEDPVVQSVVASDVLPSATGNASYQFSVVYSDNSQIDVSTIDTSDVTVTGPGGAVAITNASESTGTDGTPKTATYSLTPPGGTWDFADNGTYTIAMVGSQVFDDQSAFVAGDGSLATFEVRVSSGEASLFTDKANWETAIGGNGEIDWTEDFEGIDSTTDWSVSTQDMGPFVLSAPGGASDTFSNYVDYQVGSQIGDVSGVSPNYAAMFVDQDDALTVEMEFDSPVRAWIAEFFEAEGVEELEIDLVDVTDTVVDILEIDLASDGDFGFTTARSIKKLVFRGLGDLSPGGELFAIDNLCAASVIPTFTVVIDGSSISENGGTTTASVTRNTNIDAVQTVNLASADTDEATVPSSVDIAADETLATFTITGVPDSLVDNGTPTVTITASASGFTSGTDTVEVSDVDVATLTVSISPGSISETGGAATGTVTRNTEDVSSELVVNLSSNDTSEATVPSTVTIPATSSSNTFAISASGDELVDGTKTVTITGAATGFVDGADTVDVTDDDTLTLTLSIDPGSISENGGTATGTVTRNSEDLSAMLVVSLSSDDDGEAEVPADVTLPISASSETFTVTGVDDSLFDGTQTATVTASASGYSSAQDTVSVTDDDAQIEARMVFYNDSYWDDGAGANASDDDAIALLKNALVPGGVAEFANYTSYSKGLNGVMIDISNLQGTPTAADFEFRTGNDNAPGSWSAAEDPSTVAVRAGAGASGSDRVTLIWANNNLDGSGDANEAVANAWLQITVKNTPNTGLPADDVFYFGNAVAEVGDNAANADVTAADVQAVRDNQRSFFNPADVDFEYDIDRDKRVDITDINLTRLNQTSGGVALINLSGGVSEPLVGVDELDDTDLADDNGQLEFRTVEGGIYVVFLPTDGWRLEAAPSPVGPWTPVDPANAFKQAQGALYFEFGMGESSHFYRVVAESAE